MQVSVYIATSVDGFIAREGGDIGWLHTPQYQIEGEDFGYADFMGGVDCLVMGRNTYEKILEFESWPFAGKRVIVLSRTLQSLPAGIAAELSAENPHDLLARLRADGIKKIYLDGGKTIQSFLQAKFVTDITVTCVPVLLGGGLPLFGSFGSEINLQLKDTRKFGNGFVQNTWLLT